MKRQIFAEKKFERAFKKLVKKHYDEDKMFAVIECLQAGKALPFSCKDHALVGDLQGLRECHIEPDWLLIYELSGTMLTLVDTGSHDELFRGR